ncbi:MAG: hypothetical protein AAGG38_14915 [Planctomycetota bacterium]
MSPRNYDLDFDDPSKPPRPKGQGDGWTLEEHLAEHRRLATAVTFSDEPKILVATHRSPGRLKYWIALAGLGLLVGGAFAANLVPALGRFTITHYCAAVVAGCLAVILLYRGSAHTKMGLNQVGLVSRPWPPVPGIGVAIPLSKIRRFKVHKTDFKGQPAYELSLLTRDDTEHRLIPRITLKRDAYLLAMLLIDRVKRQREQKR